MGTKILDEDGLLELIRTRPGKEPKTDVKKGEYSLEICRCSSVIFVICIPYSTVYRNFALIISSDWIIDIKACVG